MTAREPRAFVDEWAAVSALNNIDPNDPEGAHAQADAILLAMAPPVVRAAYERLRDERCPWWAHS